MIIEGDGWGEFYQQKAIHKGGWDKAVEEIERPEEARAVLAYIGPFDAATQLEALSAFSQLAKKKGFASIEDSVAYAARDLADLMISQGDYQGLAKLAAVPLPQGAKESVLGEALLAYEPFSRFQPSRTEFARQEALKPIISSLAERVDLDHAFKRTKSFRDELIEQGLPAANRYKADFRRFAVQHPIKALRGEFFQETVTK